MGPLVLRFPLELVPMGASGFNPLRTVLLPKKHMLTLTQTQVFRDWLGNTDRLTFITDARAKKVEEGPYVAINWCGPYGSSSWLQAPHCVSLTSLPCIATLTRGGVLVLRAPRMVARRHQGRHAPAAQREERCYFCVRLFHHRRWLPATRDQFRLSGTVSFVGPTSTSEDLLLVRGEGRADAWVCHGTSSITTATLGASQGQLDLGGEGCYG